MAYYYIAIPTDGNGLQSWTPPTYVQHHSGDEYVYLGNTYYDAAWIDENTGIEYAVYEIDTVIDFLNGSNLGLFAHTNPSVVNGGPTSVNPGESVWDYAGISNWEPTFGEDEGNPYTPIYVFDSSYIPRPKNTWINISGGKEIYVDVNQACYKFSISVTANTTYTFSLYTYSENNFDGIMISTNGSLSYGNIYVNSSASSTSGYINHCTGLGTTKTATYTPTSSGTIYVYFKTDSINISDYNSTGCSYGRITWVTGTTTTITLSKNGGSGGTNSVTGAYGSALPSITAPTRSGLVFLGYYDTSAISGGTEYYDSSGTPVRNWDKTGSTYTLYARWKNRVTWSYYTTYHYCTLDAASASTTNTRRSSTLAMNPSCGTGTLSATLTSIYNDDTSTTLPSSSIGSGTNQWTLSSDGKTLTVPSGVSAANYEIHVSYTSPSGSNYVGETETASAYFYVMPTYITNYGNVYDYNLGDVASGEIYSGNIDPVEPGDDIVASVYLAQANYFPASAFTMSTSTVSNYFDNTADFRQLVTYNNGASRQGTVTYSWSGSSTSFSSLGTTEHTEDFDVTFNTLTLTANGEGGKSAVVDYLNSGMRSANVCTWNAAPTISYTINSYTFPAAGGTYDVTKSNVTIPTQTGSWTSGSSASYTPSSVAYAITQTATGITGSAIGNDRRITATNNTSTSTRGTLILCIAASYKNSTSYAYVNFDQVAGSAVYGNPVVTSYYYDDFPASALSNVTPHVEYTQESTWNGVSGSGNTNTYTYSPNDAMTSGHSMAFSSSSSTLSTGFTKGTNFATTGKVSAATRGKTTGAARSTHSLLSVVVTANGKSSSSKACTACTQVANYLVWGSVSLSVSSPSTPYSMSVSGETKEITASTATQTGTYTSGSTDTYTPTISYAVKTSKTGYSLGTGSNANKVTVTNNTSTTARNGFVVTVTASGKTGTNSTYVSGFNQTQTSDRTFNQAAGAIVYETPVIDSWAYSGTALASGETRTPDSFSYYQNWTWNGVAGSGGTYTYDNNGAFATHSYTSTGTLPTGCTKGSNFSTMGTITWANRGTTVGDIRDASSNLKLTITANGKTSSAVTCSNCKQEANELGTTKYKNTSGTTGYNIVYNNPTVSFSSNTLSASGGSATVNCSVTNDTSWYYKYTSGSYSSLQTETEVGTARWRITTVVPTGTSRFHEPSSGGSNLNIGGTNYTTYASGTAVTHDNMDIILNTDKVIVTAYNTGNTSKSASISSADIVNELGTTKYKDTSGTEGINTTYVAPSCTINSGSLTAAGGTFYVTCSVTNNTSWYYRYTSGSYKAASGTASGTARWRITSQTFTPDGGSATTITRFSNPTSGGSTYSSMTLYPSGSSYKGSHSSMTTNAGTDSVTVTAYNVGDTSKTKTATATVTNSLGTTKYKDTFGTTGYNIVYNAPTVSFSSNTLSPSGGSATVNCSVTNDTNWYYKYTSESYSSLQTGTESGTARWRITKVYQGEATYNGAAGRFHEPSSGGSNLNIGGTNYTTYASGTNVTHDSMSNNELRDKVTVTAYNTEDTSKSTSVSSANIVNELGTTKYKNTSGTTGYYSQTYGTPSSVTIGSGILASGGSASLSCICDDIFKYYLRYTSGTYTSLQTDTHESTIDWTITSRTFTPSGGSATTTTRFSISDSTLSHSSMTSNVGTDKVIVRATNVNATSNYTNSSELSVTNELGTTTYKNTSGTTGYYSQTFGTPTSVTVGSGLLASGGSATASCVCNDTFKYYLKYTSGTYTSLQTDTHASTITWSINSQTFTPDGGSATTTNRFSISGSTVSHSSMGTNVGTDTVTVKATNANATSNTGTGSTSVTNVVDSISLTVGNNPISFGSSTTATVIATYTSTATQDVSNSATYSSANSTGIVSIDID